MSNDITPLILSAIADLVEEGEITLPEPLDGSTPLFSEDGLLDSIGLVTLVVAVEQAIEDQFGVQASLADERALSQKRSPFATVGSLAEYAESLLAEQQTQ